MVATLRNFFPKLGQKWCWGKFGEKNSDSKLGEIFSEIKKKKKNNILFFCIIIIKVSLFLIKLRVISFFCLNLLIAIKIFNLSSRLKLQVISVLFLIILVSLSPVVNLLRTALYTKSSLFLFCIMDVHFCSIFIFGNREQQ